MNDKRAVERLKQGDINGLAQLVRSHQIQAVRAAYLIVHDRGIAEDVVQNAFLRAYQKIGQFDATRPFGPWFMRIVVNDALKTLAHDNRLQSLEGALEAADVVLAKIEPVADSEPESAAESEELRRAVSLAMQELPPVQRAAIVLRYYLDMSEEEIAQLQDKPNGTVKWRLHSGRKKLATLLHLWRPNPQVD